jgi:hypothetical protein
MHTQRRDIDFIVANDFLQRFEQVTVVQVVEVFGIDAAALDHSNVSQYYL